MFDCDRSLARFDFPNPLHLFFFVDPFVLDSSLEFSTRELDDVSAFVLSCSLDEHRWVLQYSAFS